MKVKFAKLDENAVIPKYTREGDACLDLTAISCTYNSITNTWDYDFGLAVEIPAGHVGFIFSRSSIVKTDLILGNGTGIIDSNFRGRLGAKFRVFELSERRNYTRYYEGDRIAQLMIIPIPTIEPIEVNYDDLSKTIRGEGGWGSSGR